MGMTSQYVCAICARESLEVISMAAVAVKDVGGYLSSKQREASDKDLAGEWAQLEDLHNRK
jgi:hypothetical protein